jgi:small subunit ribosomal protein S17
MQRTFKGKIISLKMDKTAVVNVVRRSPHPLYRKLIVRNTNYKADTAGLTLEVGQSVKIGEVKPISKGKFFKILEVIK